MPILSVSRLLLIVLLIQLTLSYKFISRWRNLSARRHFCWSKPLIELKGVGSKFSEILNGFKVEKISDLLFHLPTGYIDRTQVVSNVTGLEGHLVTAKLHCLSTVTGYPNKAICQDDSGNKIFINHYIGYSRFAFIEWGILQRSVYVPGQLVLLSGKLSKSVSNQFEISNPDIAVSCSDCEAMMKAVVVEPVYSLTSGITKPKLRNLINNALSSVNITMDTVREKQSNNNSFNVIGYSEDGDDWIDSELIRNMSWPSFASALYTLHHPPASSAYIEACSKAKQRLAFEELVSLELQHKILEANHIEWLNRTNSNCTTSNISDVSHLRSVTSNDYSCESDGRLVSLLESSLPFNYTTCQKRAVEEVLSDLKSPRRMVRLVQGDVGSGKTLIAINGILAAIEAGGTALMIAPTEMLAKQHYHTLMKYFSSLTAASDYHSTPSTGANSTIESIASGLTHADFMDATGHMGESMKLKPFVGLLTGEVKGHARAKLLQDVQEGRIQCVVGTHSLFHKEVLQSFPNLKLVVVDEEQRFGAQQRENVTSLTNVLYTTATPIPRSLAILVSNDCGISILTTDQSSKRPIKTELVDMKQVDAIVLPFLQQHVPHGSKVFWVCPSIKSSIKHNESSAASRYAQLSSLFPGRVGLLHGKMSVEEKDQIMSDFSSPNGTLKVLVATTVIEVGIDVPDASICVVDRADQFGLTQLHQIRGRIGRGDAPSSEVLEECVCMFLYDDNSTHISTTQERAIDDGDASNVTAASGTSIDSSPSRLKLPARRRLEFLANSSNDCFKIAEFDLALRGPGDVFGFRQHANMTYRVASMPEYLGLLPLVHSTANLLWQGIYRGFIGLSDPRIQLLIDIFTPVGRKRSKISKEGKETKLKDGALIQFDPPVPRTILAHSNNSNT